MINVKPLDRITIETWPIPSAGLPTRVVNICTASGINTVGALLNFGIAGLKGLPGMGAESIHEIGRFANFCTRLEEGRISFDNMHALLETFLTPHQRTTLAARYSFDSATENGRTLETIAQRSGRTRERIRQVEAKALAILAGSLCQACLAPIWDLFEDFLTRQGGAATFDEIAGLNNEPLISGLDACNLLRMLCDCSRRITCRNGLFSVVPAELLQSIEATALTFLEGCNTPQHEQAVLAILPAVPALSTAATRQIVRQFRPISSTIDGRYFSSIAAASVILTEIRTKHPQPLPLKAITFLYNQAMCPGSRKGPGFVAKLVKRLDGPPPISDL